MMRAMTREELLTKLRNLKPWLEEQGIVNVRLFGSYARDEAGPDCDVDLLVDTSRPMGIEFLTTDLSDYVSGVIIPVDGGSVAR